ncbi:MAG: DsbA family protein [Anaerolineae bacterium]
MAVSGLDTLKESRDVDVEFRAFELRPPGAPPIPPEYRDRIAAGWPRVAAMARERFGLEMNQPSLAESGGTRMAHAGAKFAEAQGLAERYHRAVFRAYWQEGRDITVADTLVDIALEIGLDADAFRAALMDPTYLEQVLADEGFAASAGLSGVPAFIFGERYLVSGAQPADVLRQVADRCIAEGLVQE